jgi:hypothetical protein
MARDTGRNTYHTVGFPKDSATYQRLVQEAMESNLSIPSLIALRVADWYRLSVSGTLPHSSSVPDQAVAIAREEQAKDTSQARANAEAAARAWLD